MVFDEDVGVGVGEGLGDVVVLGISRRGIGRLCEAS
jgi:hypothetical protein